MRRTDGTATPVALVSPHGSGNPPNGFLRENTKSDKIPFVQLGLMNNPARDPLKEITRIADLGFAFVDLTLEPPQTRPEQVDARRIRRALERYELGVVGHTAYYLPFASAYDSIRDAAVAEAEKCLRVFADVGCPLMNVHLDTRAPGHDPLWILQRNADAFARLLPTAAELAITLMLENGEGDTAATLGPILDDLPALTLHLDVGHANIGTRKSHVPGLLEQYGDRLRHVHLSDNKGKGDDHLAIGAGTIDWRRELRAVKATGYDGAITLEVFYGDSDLITYSRERVTRVWESL
jgi:sugar phosphate isomerase/epimerase